MAHIVTWPPGTLLLAAMGVFFTFGTVLSVWERFRPRGEAERVAHPLRAILAPAALATASWLMLYQAFHPS